jgi:hypothetical protein
MGKTGKG